jgi:hypothetical protein
VICCALIRWLSGAWLGSMPMDASWG